MGPHVGTELPVLRVPVSRAELRRYARVSGDANPIHQDDEVAVRAGLPGVVAHGMLVMALAGRAAAGWAGDVRSLSSFRMRFTRPVVLRGNADAMVSVSGRVTEVLDDGFVRVNLVVVDGDERVVGRASAVVRAPS